MWDGRLTPLGINEFSALTGRPIVPLSSEIGTLKSARRRRLSLISPMFSVRGVSKGKVSMQPKGTFPLPCMGNYPSRGLRKKNAHIPKPMRARERQGIVVPTQIRGLNLPPLAFCYGKGTVDVSVPAPPLSFLRCRRDSLSVKSLSVSLSSGVLLRRHRGLIIIAVFQRFVKR